MYYSTGTIDNLGHFWQQYAARSYGISSVCVRDAMLRRALHAVIGVANDCVTLRLPRAF